MKKIAFVFPGQGSQSVGMLTDLAVDFPQIKETFAEASEFFGQDLWELTQKGPAEKLNQTEFTQPSLLAAGVAVWRVWTEQTEVKPQLLAGHSLGEYTALHCAGTFGFRDAIQLVSQRAHFMQQAVPAGLGAMAVVIGLDNANITKLCETYAEDDIVAPANFNSIGQTVIAGSRDAVIRVTKHASAAGAKLAKVLPVSVPSHCELMQSAAEKLNIVLNNTLFRISQIPVLHNVDVAVHTDQNDIKRALVRQLCHPVRWVETIQFFVNQGIELVIECGPGSVLAGLIKRINKQLPVISVNSPTNLDKALCEVGDAING